MGILLQAGDDESARTGIVEWCLETLCCLGCSVLGLFCFLFLVSHSSTSRWYCLCLFLILGLPVLQKGLGEMRNFAANWGCIKRIHRTEPAVRLLESPCKYAIPLYRVEYCLQLLLTPCEVGAVYWVTKPVTPAPWNALHSGQFGISIETTLGVEPSLHSYSTCTPYRELKWCGGPCLSLCSCLNVIDMRSKEVWGIAELNGPTRFCRSVEIWLVTWCWLCLIPAASASVWALHCSKEPRVL